MWDPRPQTTGTDAVKTHIETYLNRPGAHCGSTAMRNLIHHYCGLDLSEAAIFGLGSGVDSIVLEDPTMDLPVMVFGRSVSFEPDVAVALKVDYRETLQPDNDVAWEAVRQEVLAGRPTMLSGDAYYLTHRDDFDVHFPSHRFVLLGFDDNAGEALLADRIEAEPGTCTYEGLRLSRNPPDFISTYNMWGKFHGTEVKRSLADAFRFALTRTVARIHGRDSSQGDLLKWLIPTAQRLSVGLEGLRRYRELLPAWSEREDTDALAKYLAYSHEKYGTGGGNFRRLFAGFLDEATTLLPGVVDAGHLAAAVRSADLWTQLFECLTEAPAAERWGRGAEVLDRLIEVESTLFGSLDSALAA